MGWIWFVGILSAAASAVAGIGDGGVAGLELMVELAG